MKNKAILFCTVFSLLAGTLSAQEESAAPKQGFDPSRLFFGGNLGFSFGSTLTFINVTPQVGYHLSRTFSVGTGVNFIYSKYNYGYSKSEYGYAGLNVFGRVTPFRFIVLNMQPELDYFWGKTTFTNPYSVYHEPSKFVPVVLAGAGAMIPTGGRGALIVMLQYDLVQDRYSPYGKNPFVSFGFNF